MELLVAGCIAFFVTHVGISSTPLRSMMQNTMGAQPYLGVYSVISFATLGLMIYGYGQVPHVDYIWYPSETAYKVTKVMMVLGVVLLVMGTMTKNPTQVMMDKAVEEELAGLLKITRHPIQWGILIFAIAHIIANGDIASLMMFGSLAAVSFFGMLSMDARKRQEDSEHWRSFMTTTSMVPFLAIVQGKAKLSLGELNWAAFVAGVGLYAVIYWLHDMISGGVSLF